MARSKILHRQPLAALTPTQWCLLLLLPVGAIAVSVLTGVEGSSPSGQPVQSPRISRRTVPKGFVSTQGNRFEIDGRPLTFVGANVAVMHTELDRSHFSTTLQEVAKDGVKFVRIWAPSEGGEQSPVKSLGGDAKDWPRANTLPSAPEHTEVEGLVHLDRVLAAARQNRLRVQLCLANWWRDTGGVTQYLRWAGIDDAADDREPHGINTHKAMAFYTNQKAREWYKAHVKRIVTRRNTVTGQLYRDDPTIMSWELMNEAQAETGRWGERQAWVEVMSGFIRSMDPNHLIAPGVWGYRTGAELRAWLELHQLANIDYITVHHYPRDDQDVFVRSPSDLLGFIEHRARAARHVGKPIVIGEFGVEAEGEHGYSQLDWFGAFFKGTAHQGFAGAMYWIFTPDPQRGYGISYRDPSDQRLRQVIKDAAILVDAQAASAASGAPGPLPPVPHSETLTPRTPTQPTLDRLVKSQLTYRYPAGSVRTCRFERVGQADDFVWGSGIGFCEFVVPERSELMLVDEVVVAGTLQPSLPKDATSVSGSDVTLFINGVSLGTQRIARRNGQALQRYEWRTDSWRLRWAVALGKPLTLRFEVAADAPLPFGVTFVDNTRGLLPFALEVTMK